MRTWILFLPAYLLGMAAGQLVYGPLSDRFGRKPPLYAGLALYVAASAGCALAGGIDSLIALRLLQALGGCAGMVIARAVVRDLFEAKDSARMFSLLMLVMGVAPILAPLAGGYVMLAVGWRGIFWTLAGLGLAALIAVRVALPETRGSRPGEGIGVIGTLRSFRGLVGDRRFSGPVLAGGFAGAGMFGYISASPFVFIGVMGVPAEHFGWLFGLNAAGLIACSQINRRLLSRCTASALQGTTQHLIGAVAGALVGALHDASAVPMAAAFALCAIAANLALRLGKREAPA